MTARFDSDAAIARLAAGVLDCTLPKAEWTHAAHFAVTLHLLRHRADLDLPRALPGIIRAYNVASGGANTDSAGYHETITQVSLAAARAWLVAHGDMPLHIMVDALMAGPLGKPDWLLAYWSREQLFSVTARRQWQAPDLLPLPWVVAQLPDCSG
jgi:hypothetical protein